jgi:hypothetical protein
VKAAETTGQVNVLQVFAMHLQRKILWRKAVTEGLYVCITRLARLSGAARQAPRLNKVTENVFEPRCRK